MISPDRSRIWLCAVILMVLSGEAWLLSRTLFPPPLSTAPLLVWPGVTGQNSEDSDMAVAIRIYGADRGTRVDRSLSGGTKLTTFYFEWDRAETGPLLGISAHTPEVCNVASGMTFIGQGEPRIFRFPDGERLEFDTTSFRSPDGSPVSVFKCVWMQGKGTLTLRRAHDRLERLEGSFTRHAGAARVIQGGVFGVDHEEDAWLTFCKEALEQLVWTPASAPGAASAP